MHDVGIIDSKAVVDGRELLLKGNDPDVVAVHRDFVANISKGDWALLFGDAQKRGGATLRLIARAKKASARRQEAARKAVVTRRRKEAARKAWVTRRGKGPT